MGKKWKKQSKRIVSLEQLENWHLEIKQLCEDNFWGPGTEGYSVLCSLGALMGLYPRVKTQTLRTVRARYEALTCRF